MSSQGKIVIAMIVAIVVVGGGAYAFFSKPVAAPSTSIEQALEPLPQEGEHNDVVMASEHDFFIVPGESEVSFHMDEVLRGEPVTVVGTTNQVAGEITFDPEHASDVEIGLIVINARTLKTDSAQRDGAISRLILESEKPEYEFITFTPTRVEGLAQKATVGETFNLKVTGDLKIRDISKEVVFTGTAKFESSDKLTTDLKTTVKRADFKLIIPDLPFLARLEEEVELQAKLTAKKGVTMDLDSASAADGQGSAPIAPSVPAPLDEVAVPSAGVREITVTSSNFAFDAGTIRLKKGEKVRLTFKNAGGNHDFVIDELAVATKLLRGDGEDIVEFTPMKTGTFEYYCSVGNHRAMGMKGIVIVE